VVMTPPDAAHASGKGVVTAMTITTPFCIDC
jgi:hypothetical protein